MAPTRRQGLRVRPSPPKTLSAQEKNKAKCRAYRQAIKQDPVRHAEERENNAERCRLYRSQPVTDEERARINEAARLRMAKSRARKKAEREAQKVVCVISKEPRCTRAKERQDTEVLAAQREKWAAAKRKERSQWTSQKWRRHREKTLRIYHERKRKRTDVPAAAPQKDTTTPEPFTAQSNVPIPTSFPTPSTQSPYPSKSALRKARYRLKKTLQGVGKGIKTLVSTLPAVFSARKNLISPLTPKSKRIRMNIENSLSSLKKKRDKKSLAKRRLLLETKGIEIPPQLSSPYKRKMKNEGTSAAINYMEDISVHLPSKRIVSRKEKRQKKILPKRMKRVYRDFLKQHPNSKTSLRTMYRRRPRHIKTHRHHKLRQCLCEICANTDFKLDALNRHLPDEKKIDGRDLLSEKSLCPVATLACLERQCNACGVGIVADHIKSALTSDLTEQVKWQVWEVVKKEKGQRKEKIIRESTIEELISHLLVELSTLSKHIFVHRWQHNAFRTLLSKLQSLREFAVVVMDFSENYLCKWQDEVQSAHWGYNQVMVHPCVLYYNCPDCKEVITEYQVYLSNDLNHDANMVRDIVEKVKDHLKRKGVTSPIMWSDGCAAQYKSRLPFFYIAQSKVQWVYYGSRHGKSPCDACGGVVKALCDDNVRQGAIIQSAEQMAEHLAGNHALPSEPTEGCCHTLRSFYVIKDVDRSLPSAAFNTIPGTRKIQHAVGLSNGQLITRNLSCFCNVCIGEEDGKCTSSDFVLEWQQVRTTLSKAWKENPANEELLERLERTSPQPTELPSTAFSPPQNYSGTASHEERRAFFMQFQEKLKQTNSFEELHAVVSHSASTMMRFPLPPLPNLHVTSLPNARIDGNALAVIPTDAPAQHFPITIQADGNCFPRSVSLLAFGNEDEHTEMRVRIVCELSLNAARYVDPTYLSRGSADCGMNIIDVQMRYAEVPYNVSNSALQVLQGEIFIIRKPSEYCGMWALYAASNILQTPLRSVFPDKGEEDMKALAKRTISPFHPSQSQPRYIMWSSCRTDQRSEYWSPNHFVPLLPLHPQEDVSVIEEAANDVHNQAFMEVDDELCADESHQTNSYPEAEDFYLHTWLNKKDYVCQVVKVLPVDGLIHINFMTQQGEHFYWSSKPDHSWEDIPTFTASSRKVHICLDEQHSTQRKQMFTIL